MLDTIRYYEETNALSLSRHHIETRGCPNPSFLFKLWRNRIEDMQLRLFYFSARS